MNVFLSPPLICTIPSLGSTYNLFFFKKNNIRFQAKVEGQQEKIKTITTEQLLGEGVNLVQFVPFCSILKIF